MTQTRAVSAANSTTSGSANDTRIANLEAKVDALVTTLERLTVSMTPATISRASSSSVTIAEASVLTYLSNVKVPITTRWRNMTAIQVNAWLKECLVKCVEEKRDDLVTQIYEFQQQMVTMPLNTVKARILLIFEEKNLSAGEITELREPAAYNGRATTSDATIGR